LITEESLRRWPLPEPEGGDKEGRGRVLVVGGAVEMPGAIILAGTAALRAGAGKLQMGTCRSIVQAVGVAVPEALVFGLDETAAGGIAAATAPSVAQRMNQAQAALVGPGMVDPDAVAEFMRRLAPLVEQPALILDAEAMSFIADAPDALHHLAGKVIMTPHRGEMASLLGIEKDAVSADPLETVRRAAREWRAVVALKGAETYIATPDGEIYCNQSGNVGLATSGSGDTLAGVIAGLAARGASPIQAAAWGVFLHGSAGDMLAKTRGRLGFLARELLAEIPPIMARLDGEGS
jgi:hydroxyethylthiazole kinase-like uncharacterized protein yjeF